MLWWICLISKEFLSLFRRGSELTSSNRLIINFFNLSSNWNVFNYFLLDIFSSILRYLFGFLDWNVLNLLDCDLFNSSLWDLFNNLFVFSYGLILSDVFNGIIISDSLLLWHLFDNYLFFVVSVYFLIWNIFHSGFTLYRLSVLNSRLT